MKQNSILKKIAFLLASAIFMIATTAGAAVTPTVSLSKVGSGDSVQVAVTGDANASVILYYTPTGLGLQIKAIGTTNSSGSFSTTITSSAYGLKTNNPVYVSVGGINGLVSSTSYWPTVTTTTSNILTVNPSGVVLSVGQTRLITVTNNTSSSLYVSNNSNSSVASAAVSGNQITLLALGYGTTSVTVCAVGYTADCPSVTVTVPNGTTQTLSLSQSSVSLSYGQSTAVTISGGTGTYIVSNNSSANNVSASINGNVLVLGGNSSTSGTYSVTVCSSDMSACGVVSVVLGGTTSSSITFSQNAPSLSVGQSIAVSVYGGASSSYYISSNSNTSVTQSNITNNILTLFGVTNGTSIINVCASVGSCSSLTVTVNNNTSATNPVYLAQSSMTLVTGKTSSVAISGGTTPYVLLTPSNTIFQAGISGSTLYLTGLAVGSAQVTICNAASTGCASLSLQVTGTQTTTTSTTATSFLNFSTSNPVLNIGQSTSISISGGVGSAYTVAYNSNSGIVQANTNGSVLTLYGLGNGKVVVVVCDGSSNCGPLAVSSGTVTTTTTVTPTPSPATSLYPAGCASASGYSTTTGLPCGSGTTTTTTATTPATTSSYKFTLFLQQGMTGNEVTELQKRLSDLGYLTASANGNFGPMTKSAVAAFQRAHGISAVGYVGPSTRALLNVY